MIVSLLMVIKLAEVDAMINNKEFCDTLTQELFMAYPVQAVEILKTVDLHGLGKDDILPILGRFFGVR